MLSIVLDFYWLNGVPALVLGYYSLSELILYTVAAILGRTKDYFK